MRLASAQPIEAVLDVALIHSCPPSPILMTIFSGFRRSRNSGSANQCQPPPSVAGSLPPSYQSVFPETASVRIAKEKNHQRSTSIPSGALTASDSGSTKEIDTLVSCSDRVEPAQGPANSYVYYTFFTKDGAVPCKHPVDRRDPYLGRVEARRIAPPHTVESVIRCICNVEGDARYHSSKLFLSASSASPMDRGEHMAILAGSGPGSNPWQPLALLLDESDLYCKAIIAECARTYGNNDSNWLSYEKGDELFTDGIKREETYQGPLGSTKFDAYRARNANGQYGFVFPHNFSEAK